jgi:hypothetical protein
MARLVLAAQHRVEDSFDRLQTLFMCGNGPDPKPIEDMVINRIADTIMKRRNL